MTDKLEPQEPQEQPVKRVKRSRWQKLCPSCNKKIPADARKCRYCGELLDAGRRRPAPPPKKTSGCLIAAIVGICIVGLLGFVGIIAAIAIPNLLESRTAANGAAAISSCRVISSAQELHHARFDRYATLEELAGNMFIDTILAGGRKSGYDFELAVAEDRQSWSMTAVPTEPGTTGSRSFYIGTDGVIYYSPCTDASDPPADSSSTPLGW